MNQETAFQEFIKGEMYRRQMSAREFARFVDVSPTTITRSIDERNPTLPGLDFLIKLSKATHTSLTALVEMAYPDITASTTPSPTAQVLAQQIEQLPDAIRETVVAIIRGSGVGR